MLKIDPGVRAKGGGIFMKLSTKALLSSLVAAAVNAVPAKQRTVSQRETLRYEKVLQKHDRKCELRAGVLGISTLAFKDQIKRRSLSEVVKRYGFIDERSFYVAVVGKIRDELHHRGWTPQRVDRFTMSRAVRLPSV